MRVFLYQNSVSSYAYEGAALVIYNYLNFFTIFNIATAKKSVERSDVLHF